MNKKAASITELSLLARPAVYEDEMDVRKFYALKGEEVIGFVYFDPMYRDGKVYGYIANILRSDSNSSYSVCDFIILEAMKQFKEEGIEELSLGFSPFCDVDDTGEFNHSKTKTAVFKFMFEHCCHLYSFKSLAFHKKKYRPGIEGTREVKVYCASKTSMPIVLFYSLLYKMGLRPIAQTVCHVSTECVSAGSKLMNETGKGLSVLKAGLKEAVRAAMHLPLPESQGLAPAFVRGETK